MVARIGPQRICLACVASTRTRTVPDMTASPETEQILDLLVEHDEVLLTLSRDGRISVQVPGLGAALVDRLAELAPLLAEPARFVPSDPRQRLGEPRGVVLKAAADRDLYVVWSNVVDNAVVVGTREEMLAHGVRPSRLARADRYGTSAASMDMPDPYPRPFRAHGWGDTTDIVVNNQQDTSGLLPRARLADFLDAIYRNDEDAATALLDPFEDEDTEN